MLQCVAPRSVCCLAGLSPSLHNSKFFETMLWAELSTVWIVLLPLSPCASGISVAIWLSAAHTSFVCSLPPSILAASSALSHVPRGVSCSPRSVYAVRSVWFLVCGVTADVHHHARCCRPENLSRTLFGTFRVQRQSRCCVTILQRSWKLVHLLTCFCIHYILLRPGQWSSHLLTLATIHLFCTTVA